MFTTCSRVICISLGKKINNKGNANLLDIPLVKIASLHDFPVLTIYGHWQYSEINGLSMWFDKNQKGLITSAENYKCWN